MTTTEQTHTARQEVLAAHLNDVRQLMARIEYRGDDYRWRVEIDQADPANGRVFVQLEHLRPDAVTGVMAWGRSGKRYLSEHMTTSEIVRQAFGLALGYEEHEVREFFRYRPAPGRSAVAVFGPHIDVDALAEVADELDVRL